MQSAVIWSAQAKQPHLLHMVRAFLSLLRSHSRQWPCFLFLGPSFPAVSWPWLGSLSTFSATSSWASPVESSYSWMHSWIAFLIMSDKPGAPTLVDVMLMLWWYVDELNPFQAVWGTVVGDVSSLHVNLDSLCWCYDDMLMNSILSKLFEEQLSAMSLLCMPIWIQMTPDNESVDHEYIHDIEEQHQWPPASKQYTKALQLYLLYLYCYIMYLVSYFIYILYYIFIELWIYFYYIRKQ